MAGTDRKSKVEVCLVSSHPLFLRQFQGSLVSSGLRLQSSQVSAENGTQTLPRAAVYVVDSCSHPRLTEALVSSIVNRYPTAATVVMVDSFTEPVAFSLLGLGVKGILQYTDAEQQLPRALQAVGGGGYWIPRAILGRFVEHVFAAERRARRSTLRIHSPLSRREREILDSLLENLTNKEIASRLNISERTVKFHVSNVLSKYGVQRRADLILLSYQERQIV